MSLPDTIRDPTELDQLLSEPTAPAIEAMSRIDGDMIVLGAGGKMGPTLTRMIQRASQEAAVSRRVIAVSRFSNDALERQLRQEGIETFRGDLLDERTLEGLPDAANVLFMTGMKFGSSKDAATTWAMNTYLPSLVCRRFPRSRILVFSTGNVYPFVAADSGGCVETDPLAPVGEYGMSALGRERMFEYFSRRDSIPMTIVRLNYAVEMRYGVLVDIARQVFEGQPIDLSMGYANVIWQGDANAMALAALADTEVPPFVVNVAGPELVRVRDVSQRFGELFGKQVRFVNQESPTALLSNGSAAHARYGKPRVSLERLIQWIADWLNQGGVIWHKPTHFQVRDGQF